MCIHYLVHETIVDGPIGFVQVERRCLLCKKYESHILKNKENKEDYFKILTRRLSSLDIQAIRLGWRPGLKIKSEDLRKHKNMYIKMDV